MTSNTPSLGSKDLTSQISIDSMHPFAIGGFANVCQATWTSTDGAAYQVAIKLLHIDLTKPGAREKVNKRLQREVRIWSRLRHNHIVPLLGYVMGNEPGLVSLWYALGNLDGFLGRRPDLTTMNKDVLVSQQCLDRHPSQIDQLSSFRCTDISLGLHYLHTHEPPVVHGDLSAQNVLVGLDGIARLCDFGLSLTLDDHPANFTSTSIDAGAIRFRAPEMSLDPPMRTLATDIFALGCLLGEILSGEKPYVGHSTMRVLSLIGNTPPFTDLKWDGIFSISLLSQCWAANANLRPTIHSVVDFLQESFSPNMTLETLTASIGGSIKSQEGRFLFSTVEWPSVSSPYRVSSIDQHSSPPRQNEADAMRDIDTQSGFSLACQARLAAKQHQYDEACEYGWEAIAHI